MNEALLNKQNACGWKTVRDVIGRKEKEICKYTEENPKIPKGFQHRMWSKWLSKFFLAKIALWLTAVLEVCFRTKCIICQGSVHSRFSGKKRLIIRWVLAKHQLHGFQYTTHMSLSLRGVQSLSTYTPCLTSFRKTTNTVLGIMGRNPATATGLRQIPNTIQLTSHGSVLHPWR